MPEPIKRGQRYMPGLDGLRAIAVLGVLLYHAGFAWIPGGLLGVGVFFTLSGYLITDLLLAQAARGRIDLGAFWLARIRRLVPAVVLLVIVVLAWVTVIGPSQTSDLRDAVVSAALYVNNWWLIIRDVSYFEAFAAPQPLTHLWSLSVEEQFYIVWPLALMLGLRLASVRGAGNGALESRIAILAIAMALSSAVLMAVLYRPGVDPSRVYYGTDTRVQELLVGAALAAIWPSRRLRPDIAAPARNLLDGAGIVALGVIVLLFLTCTEFSPFLYYGGFLVLSFSTALLVAVLAHPGSRLGPAIGCRPMRWVGQRSYGIYLWHFPVIVLTSPQGQHDPDLLRIALQITATFAIAALSWRYVEDPIRHGAFGQAWKRVRSGAAAYTQVRALSRPRLALLSASVFVFLAATAGFAGVGMEDRDSLGATAVARTVNVAVPVRAPMRTHCRSVVHIGDSTSLGLDAAEYLPAPGERISAQYARVGATRQHLDISGGRSIHERYKGQPNAEEAARGWRDQGVKGCWVLAMGTNEAANVAAGSKVGFDQRVDAMMQALAGQRVMWVNVKSLVRTGSYSADYMKGWNAVLLEACRRYPSMRIYDWASEVRDDWFVEDGIHFTSAGYAKRARYIADALLEAFPAGVRTPSSNCLIRPAHPLTTEERAARLGITDSGAPAATVRALAEPTVSG